jgi:hypothetical protein
MDAMKLSPTGFEDDLERAFPGARILHRLELTTDASPEVLAEVVNLLPRSPGCLERLVVQHRNGSYCHELVLTGVRAAEARRLADTLARLDGVSRVHAEHQLTAGPPTRIES